MATNNKKYKYFGIVLNAPNEKATEREIRDFLSAILTALKDYNIIKFYASAIHDKDHHEDGTPKRTHCHIMVETYEEWTHLQFLVGLSIHLNIDKKLLSISDSNNLFLLVQYLTHKNDQDKHQYDYEIIKTNNAEYCEQLYETIYESPNDKLKKALRDAQSLDQFIELLGVQDANKYRNLFKDLKIEQKQDYNSIMERNAKLSHEYESLWNYTSDLLTTLKMALKDSEKRLINFERYDNVFFDTFIKPK